MNKNDMRVYLNSVKPYINISGICRELKIPKQTMSLFINGYDGAISTSKLLEFIDFIAKLG